jgi:hypothetical protein
MSLELILFDDFILFYKLFKISILEKNDIAHLWAFKWFFLFT